MMINIFMYGQPEPIVMYRGFFTTYSELRRNLINELDNNKKVIINLTTNDMNDLSIHLFKLSERIVKISIVQFVNEIYDFKIYLGQLLPFLDEIINIYKESVDDFEELLDSIMDFVGRTVLTKFPVHTMTIEDDGSFVGQLYKMLCSLQDFKNGEIQTLIIDDKKDDKTVIISQVVVNRKYVIPEEVKEYFWDRAMELNNYDKTKLRKYRKVMKKIITIDTLLKYLRKTNSGKL